MQVRNESSTEPAGETPPPAPRHSESLPAQAAETGYYGLPLLKPPVWTWEVPVYFFVGGAAGAAAVIAEVARLRADAGALARDARWLAAAGGALSAPLLIADLGRPERFLNMLRVFKPQSPMSAGVWIVVAFSSTAAAALAAQTLGRQSSRMPWRLAEGIAGPLAALFGLGMATYTGVLLGVTAVPAWSRHARLLPFQFAFSGLGAAVSILELRGHTHAGLRRLALAAALAETVAAARLETGKGPSADALKHGTGGVLMRAAGLASGPVPVILRAVVGSPRAMLAAAAAAVAGSLLTRFAWVSAGRASARDPRAPLI